jgi:murein DD-endopeptidase MepM/ murein hydrolase activator NlpD
MVTKDQVVYQGQMIGIMGDTGENPATGEKTSFGEHLHITFYYQGNALNSNSILALNLLRMEGRLLKDYKLSTNWNGKEFEPIFYPKLYPPQNLKIISR